MTRKIIALIGLVMLAGCSGGGGDSATPSSAPAPLAQPDMLTATPQGLLRGKANGQGQRLIFSRPNMQKLDLFLSDGLVYYPREAPPVVRGFPNQDIWSVRSDGTGDHAVINTTANEFVRDVSGNVAIYSQDTYTLASGLEHADYGSLRDGAPLALLPIHEPFTQYRFMVDGRAYFNNEQQLFSVLNTGAGLTTHATAVSPRRLEAEDAFGTTVIHREVNLPSIGTTLLFATVSGGGSTPLTDELTYVIYAGHVGNRIVYQTCPLIAQLGLQNAGPCDVQSVNSDGSGRVALAANPVNESVQGVIGNEVIIRRNLSGNDQLIAVPVGGGPERLLMTMTDSEFVQLVVGDLLIVQRPTGTWTLDLNGTLKQIGAVQGFSGFRVVGNAVCLNRAPAVWCMPLDGSTPAVKIADDGQVVGVL
jgi:hypothetical protein